MLAAGPAAVAAAELVGTTAPEPVPTAVIACDRQQSVASATLASDMAVG